MQQVRRRSPTPTRAALLVLGRDQEALSGLRRRRPQAPTTTASPTSPLRCRARWPSASQPSVATARQPTCCSTCLHDRAGLDAHLGLLVRSPADRRAPPRRDRDAIRARGTGFGPAPAARSGSPTRSSRPGSLIASRQSLGPRRGRSHRPPPPDRPPAGLVERPLGRGGLATSCPLVLGTAERHRSGDSGPRAAVADLVFKDPIATMALTASVLSTPAPAVELLAALEGPTPPLPASVGTLEVARRHRRASGGPWRSPNRAPRRRAVPGPHRLRVGVMRSHGHAVPAAAAAGAPRPALAPNAIAVYGFAADDDVLAVRAIAELTGKEHYDTVVLIGGDDAPRGPVRALDAARGSPLRARRGEHDPAPRRRGTARPPLDPRRGALGRPRRPVLEIPDEARTGLLIAGQAPVDTDAGRARIRRCSRRRARSRRIARRRRARPSSASPRVLRLGPLANPLPGRGCPAGRAVPRRRARCASSPPAPRPWLSRSARRRPPSGCCRRGQHLTGARVIAPLAAYLEQCRPGRPARPPRCGGCTRWTTPPLRGSLFGHDSLSTVNRELVLALVELGRRSRCSPRRLRQPRMTRLLAASLQRELPVGGVALEIRHAFPPLFTPAHHPLGG